MANPNGLNNRLHIVVVPGFGGFDALGNIEYYAGVTPIFQEWREHSQIAAVLHYFDNLPTAAVVSRATRLRQYLAKRIARGEILTDDSLVLVGHSTAGLDIRQLVYDLHQPENDPVYVEGGLSVPARVIRKCLRGVVFLSVPHWGTNIADWVHSHPGWRRALIAELHAAVEGAQVYPVDMIQTTVTSGAARLTGADILLAFRDALAESNAHYGTPSPMRTAEALETAADLGLYFDWMRTDFNVVDDLTARLYSGGTVSPAHFTDEQREAELELWASPAIRTLSYATVAPRPYHFPSGRPAPVWELTNPFTYFEITKDSDLIAGTDLSYRVCYRACAGGPLRWPARSGKVSRAIGDIPPTSVELWDNDGIVNTVSMFWPRGDIVLVGADHLDIIGHYRNVRAEPGLARQYRAYDPLKSASHFGEQMLTAIWTEIFDFCANLKEPRRGRRRAKAAATAVGLQARYSN